MVGSAAVSTSTYSHKTIHAAPREERICHAAPPRCGKNMHIRNEARRADTFEKQERQQNLL
jgi:hypothetical protein